MNLKYLNTLNGLIVLVLLMINGWIYFNRNDGYAYQEVASYNQIYQHDEMCRITDFSTIGEDSVKLVVRSKRLFSNSSIDTSIFIKIDEGNRRYVIPPLNSMGKDSIVVGISRTSEQTYAINGRNNVSKVGLMYSNTPIGKTDLFPFNHWQQKFPLASPDDSIIANHLLLDSIKILENDNDLTRVEKIASYILTTLERHRGIPIDSMDKMSPIQQFQCARSGMSKVWCWNFSQIFSFLANRAGIVTRSVDLGGNIEGVVEPEPIHSFNEVFIEELNQWVFIDLSSKAIFVKSSSGKFLNTIQFYHAHLIKSNLTAVTLKQDSLLQVDYGGIKPFYDDVFRGDSYFLFYFKSQFSSDYHDLSSKLERYFTKAPTYAAYSDSNSGDNRKFYIKQFFFYTLVIYSLYVLVFTVLLNYSKRIRIE
jgi:hypothetical protein